MIPICSILHLSSHHRTIKNIGRRRHLTDPLSTCHTEQPPEPAHQFRAPAIWRSIICRYPGVRTHPCSMSLKEHPSPIRSHHKQQLRGRLFFLLSHESQTPGVRFCRINSPHGLHRHEKVCGERPFLIINNHRAVNDLILTIVVTSVTLDYDYPDRNKEFHRSLLSNTHAGVSCHLSIPGAALYLPLVPPAHNNTWMHTGRARQHMQAFVNAVPCCRLHRFLHDRSSISGYRLVYSRFSKSCSRVSA